MIASLRSTTPQHNTSEDTTMLFKDQKQGDPFGPKGQEQKQEDEDFSPPKVGEFLQKSKQLLNEARTPMYCNLCGLDVLACQHYNGVHEGNTAVSYTHLRAHETPEHLVCRLL